MNERHPKLTLQLRWLNASAIPQFSLDLERELHKSKRKDFEYDFKRAVGMLCLVRGLFVDPLLVGENTYTLASYGTGTHITGSELLNGECWRNFKKGDTFELYYGADLEPRAVEIIDFLPGRLRCRTTVGYRDFSFNKIWLMKPQGIALGEPATLEVTWHRREPKVKWVFTQGLYSS